jgi:hypothetical protein
VEELMGVKEEFQGIGMTVELENWKEGQIFMKSPLALIYLRLLYGIYFADQKAMLSVRHCSMLPMI